MSASRPRTDVYSPFKILHHTDRIEQLRQGIQIVPTQVHLIISDLCNQDCSFCAYRWSGYTSNQLFGVLDPKSGEVNNNPNRMIPYEKVVEILDDCKDMGVKAVQLTGGGEPSIHPKFDQILEDIHIRGLDLALVSNGGKLSEKAFEQLRKAKWVRISIDSGNAETYSKTRKVSGKTWDRVWGNIRRLADEKSEDTVLGIGFVVTKDNWREVTEGTRIAKENGADNIRLSAVFQPDDDAYFADFYEEVRAECQAAKHDFDDTSFKVFNNFGERIDDLKQHSPDYEFCGYQQLVSYIGGDMNVYRCCVYSYNERGKLGSIQDQSFREFWESEGKRQAIQEFDARGCDRCMFNAKNRIVNYLLEKNPDHVNYI